MTAGKKRGGRIIIIIILIVAVGAVLAYLLLTQNTGTKTPNNQVAATPTPNYALVDIVIASQYIPRGTLITGDMVTTIKYPQNEIPQGTFFGSIEEAVGTKAKYNIEPSVPLTTNMVIHEDGGSTVSFDIPSGMTAFSIPASPETSVAFAPQKGDHVMVIGCMLLTDLDTDFQTRLPNNSANTMAPGLSDAGVSNSISITPSIEGQLALYGRYELDPSTSQLVFVNPSETQRPRLVCQTIIQDSMVLQVGMFPLTTEETTAPLPTPIVTEQDPAAATTTVQYPGSVTLVVSPQDSLILNYLLLSGSKLSLALRAAGDTGSISTDPVTLQYVMDQKNIPSPAKLPYGVEPRVDSLVYPGFNDYILIQP